MMDILIAEDEFQIASTLKKNFDDEGHCASIVFNGEDALISVKSSKFDAILLDWKMPKVSGIDVCRKIREHNNTTPIILLTALDGISNKVEALNAGADDYVTKPFSFIEVMARVNAVVRRSSSNKEVLNFGNISLDLIKRKVKVNGKEDVHLTDKEFDLLRCFIQNKGEILSKEKLCEIVWDLKFKPETNICEATVKNLRKKLESISDREYIKTIYGEGYILIEE